MASERRLTLADQQMVGPHDRDWPVTYRFYMETRWGLTQQDLTVDMPSFEGQTENTQAFGPVLWSLAIAPAISIEVGLYAFDFISWRTMTVPNFVIAPSVRGHRFATPAARGDTAQLVLNVGTARPQDRRRFFLPGYPAGWSERGLLNRDGWEGLIAHARGMYMGMQPIIPDPVMHWLVAYPDAIAPELGNLRGVGFRQVTSVRVCWHLDKAPEFSPGGLL